MFCFVETNFIFVFFNDVCFFYSFSCCHLSFKTAKKNSYINNEICKINIYGIIYLYDLKLTGQQKIYIYYLAYLNSWLSATNLTGTRSLSTSRIATWRVFRRKTPKDIKNKILCRNRCPFFRVTE